MVERTLPKPDTRVRFPSAAPQAPDLMVWGFYFLGWMRWLGAVGRVEAVCSLLLQGTRPRFASDTLMSRRNIPASPLLSSPLLRAGGVVGADARCGTNHGRSAWEECARRRGRNTRVRYRKQLAKNEYWVQGIAVTPYGRSGHLPAGSDQEGFSTTMRARSTAISS